MKMPVLFVGHGSPENLVWENSFTYMLRHLHSEIRRPQKILVISAHWETQGISITGHQNPDLKYDFFGFPSQMYSLTYPVQIDYDLVSRVRNLLSDFRPHIDLERGFDHGVWSVLYHLYPKADIPIVQISLPVHCSFRDYFEMGQRLSVLRDENTLILGSGNIVHNLRQISGVAAEPYPWAKAFDEEVKEGILKKEYERLLHWDPTMKYFGDLAHPSTDHYLPLLYCLGAAQAADEVIMPYEGFQYGSISMRTVLWRSVNR